MVLGAALRSDVCGFPWVFAYLEVPYADPETGEGRLGAMLTVKRVIIQLGGKLHEEETAKTRAGDRLVFLEHETAELLRQQRQASGRRRRPRLRAHGSTPTWCSASRMASPGSQTTCPRSSSGWRARLAFR
jgi:hypothetical protein